MEIEKLEEGYIIKVDNSEFDELEDILDDYIALVENNVNHLDKNDFDYDNQVELHNKLEYFIDKMNEVE